MEQISHSELIDLEEIGQGAFGVVYRSKHARYGPVLYEEHDDEDVHKLRQRLVYDYFCVLFFCYLHYLLCHIY